jgi:hypothetical protein
MARARQEAEWDRTAAILATIVNINRDPRKSRPVSTRELNPYRDGTAHVSEDAITVSRDEAVQLFRQMAASAKRR